MLDEARERQSKKAEQIIDNLSPEEREKSKNKNRPFDPRLFDPSKLKDAHGRPDVEAMKKFFAHARRQTG